MVRTATKLLCDPACWMFGPLLASSLPAASAHLPWPSLCTFALSHAAHPPPQLSPIAFLPDLIHYGL